MTTSTIEIFVRPVKKTFGLAQHIYLISTDSQGHKKILRAGPETSKETGMLTDDLKVVYTDYIKENKKIFDGDWDPKNKVKLLTIPGKDTEIQAKMEKMWEIGKKINAGNYDYKLPTPFCPESICHIQNSNTAANLLVKAINIDLKPFLEVKKLWAPGIDANLDHTMIDKFTHDYIDGLQVMQGVLDGIRESKDQNTNLGLATIFSQAKDKVVQFRAHQGEYSAAEEYAKFGQLIKDLDLSFVLDENKAYKYKMHALDKDYYGNSPVEVFNKYMPEYHNKLMSEGGIISYQWTLQNYDQYRVYYQVKAVRADNSNYKTNEFMVVNKNSYYDPSYTPLITNQCSSLAAFRDRSSLLHEKIDEICTFVGVDHTLSHTES